MFGIESYKNKKAQNNSSEDEDKYRQKYLKYKQKYLELKQSGGGLDGVYAYFTTEEKAKELVKLFTNCGSPSDDNLNSIFNQDGLNVSAENKKSELKTTLQSFYTQCNNPTQLEIDTLLNDEAYRIKKDMSKSPSKIELISTISTGTKIFKSASKLVKKGSDAPKSKKNSGTVDNKARFIDEEDQTLQSLLVSIKAANVPSKHPDSTKLTHYVLINHKSAGIKITTKDLATLVDKSDPVKVLPSY